MARKRKQTGPVRPERQTKPGHVWAEGLVAHHFWGEYCATIALIFDDDASRRDALATLGEPWRPAKSADRVLYCDATGETLKRVEAQLEAYGADRELMGSLRFSCDVGEPFAVLIPVTPAEQAPLFDKVGGQ